MLDASTVGVVESILAHWCALFAQVVTILFMADGSGPTNSLEQTLTAVVDRINARCNETLGGVLTGVVSMKVVVTTPGRVVTTPSGAYFGVRTP